MRQSAAARAWVNGAVGASGAMPSEQSSQRRSTLRNGLEQLSIKTAWANRDANLSTRTLPPPRLSSRTSGLRSVPRLRPASVEEEMDAIDDLDLRMRTGPAGDAGTVLAPHGVIEFQARKPDRPLAKFACLTDDSDPNSVVELLRTWLPDPPNVIISVTGSAQRMQLDSQLEQLILAGIASAARSTHAWIIE